MYFELFIDVIIARHLDTHNNISYCRLVGNLVQTLCKEDINYIHSVNYFMIKRSIKVRGVSSEIQAKMNI